MKTGILISTITTSLLLVGCGDSSNNSGTTPEVNSTMAQGYYVDTAVRGVNYQCGSQRGVTEASGRFLFEKNTNCTFKLGEVLLRDINATLLEDKITILEDNTDVARLLQTLDRDGNASNGIEIIEETHNVLKELSIREIPKNIALLIDIKDKLKEKAPTKYDGRVVSKQEVLRHLEETRTALKEEGKKTQYDIESSQNNENNHEVITPTTPNQEGNSSNHQETTLTVPNQDNNNSAITTPTVSNQNDNGNNPEETIPTVSNQNDNDNNPEETIPTVSNQNENSNNNQEEMTPTMPNQDNNDSEIERSENHDNINMEENNTQNNTTNNANLGTTNFTKALAIPTLAPYQMVEGYKVFNLEINESTTQFFDGIQTKTAGVNANVLGQTIRIHNGDAVKLVYHNNLNEPTTMHGHGMHVPAVMDGGPINKIQPNTSWTAQYTVNQEASTNWYHPHLMGKTAEQVYHGLAGVIIIDDALSDVLDLPKTYGVDDIPIVLQDKFFDENGQIDYSPTRMQIMRGYTGGHMLANAVINPYLDVPAKQVRLRLVNGSNASLYRLEFTDKHEFYQIASDNSFLEEPVKMSQVVLTPAERAEIVIDFSNDFNRSFILKDLTLGKEIMKINVNKVATTHNQLPTQLTTIEKLNPANAVRTRKFVLGMSQGHMTINGKSMDMKRIDELVPQNDIEIWDITNMMGIEHSFHIHSTHFLALERNGSPDNLTPAEYGYKDVIRLAGRDNVKVIVQMTDFPDESTAYMYHCHFLEHEDDGMMGQFAITNGEVAINVGGQETRGMGNNNNRRGQQP